MLPKCLQEKLQSKFVNTTGPAPRFPPRKPTWGPFLGVPRRASPVMTHEFVKSAFTLIELLVVISIIAILATLLIANFNATRGRARDAQRKSDLRNIQTALRLYYNDFGKYPTNSDENIRGCDDGTEECLWGTSFTANNVYMSTLPEDPQSDRNYVYTYIDDDTYSLSACLENVSDDNCSVSDCTGDFGTGATGCTYTVQP